MAQIQKGTTYSTGDQVTATNLNALADAAILLPGAITDQTAKTVPLAADTVLIHSAADTALRKSTLTQLFSNATGIPLTTGVTGILPAANGGTGVANASTLTLAGNVTHSGAFTQTFTATANTSLTLPTTGTLATLAGSEALSNKTITASPISGSTGAFTTLSATGALSTTIGGDTITLGASGVGYLQTFSRADANYIRASSAGGYFVFQTGGANNRAVINDIGLDVTGALSSTTGATFATSSGNVGVGTASPAYKLDTLGTSRIGGDLIVQGQTNAATLQLLGLTSVTDGAWSIASKATRSLAFTDDYQGLERMRIDSSGNVGIGVTPSAWDTYKSLELPNEGYISSGSAWLEIMMNTYYGSGAYRYKSTAAASHYLQQGGAHIWYNAASGTAGNAISFTQAMTLDASGNLGVGLTAGLYSKIGVSGNIMCTDGGQIGWLTSQGAPTDYIDGSQASHYMRFITNNTERARIDSSGNLLVGKTADVLANAGCLLDNRGSFTFTRDGAAVGYINRLTSDGDALVLMRSTTQVGSISVTTTATAYNTGSDYRLKDITGSLTDSGTFIDALKPRVGTWKADGSKFVGFLAHEFAEVSPSSVTGEKDAVDADGKPVYQAMQASSAEVIANLVAELQSLRQRVAALENS